MEAKADELEELYDVKPDEFTALRTKLAKAAKQRGDADTDLRRAQTDGGGMGRQPPCASRPLSDHCRFGHQGVRGSERHQLEEDVPLCYSVFTGLLH
jgi:hypothetical protein